MHAISSEPARSRKAGPERRHAVIRRRCALGSNEETPQLQRFSEWSKGTRTPDVWVRSAVLQPAPTCPARRPTRERDPSAAHADIAAPALQAPLHSLDLRRADKVEFTDQANANASIGLIVLGKGKGRAFIHWLTRGSASLFGPEYSGCPLRSTATLLLTSARRKLFRDR